MLDPFTNFPARLVTFSKKAALHASRGRDNSILPFMHLALILPPPVLPHLRRSPSTG
jgi:hypothetical protein